MPSNVLFLSSYSVRWYEPSQILTSRVRTNKILNGSVRLEVEKFGDLMSHESLSVSLSLWRQTVRHRPARIRRPQPKKQSIVVLRRHRCQKYATIILFDRECNRTTFFFGSQRKHF